MSPQTRFDRFVSLSAARSSRRSRGQLRAVRRRLLRLEPLEERRLLAVVTVDTLDDSIDFNDGRVSLREAIFATNTVPGPDTIEFAPSLTAGGPATILLTQGELAITDALTIAGPGANLLTIDASGSDPNTRVSGDGIRIFNVDDGKFAINIDVAIRGLTLTGGDTNQHGGAILSREKLLADELTVSGNQATLGGAIALFATNSKSVVSNSIISHSRAAAQGGAFFLQLTNAGVISLQGNTISHNEGSRGGAIYAGPGDPNSLLSITSNTIAENSALTQGGGIFVSPQSPTTTIRDTTISGNTSVSQGGGLFANSGRNLTILNSQILENRSTGENPSQGRGGGIYATNSRAAITGSTISGNAALVGGGIYSRNGDLSVNFSSVSDNTASRGNGGGIYSNRDRLTLSGSTISGNRAMGNDKQGLGGGLWHAPSFAASTTIADSTLSGNSANAEGGGLYFRPTQETAASASLVLSNLVVSGNSAGRGGGISAGIGSVGISAGTLLVDGGMIAGNTAATHGGGVYTRLGNLTIQGTTITGNRANGNGGGIAGPTNGGQGGQWNLIGAIVSHNEAGTESALLGDGGGVWIGPGSINATFIDSRLDENSARRGGAIYHNSFNSQSSLLVTNSSISGNTSANRGGGIYNQGGLLSIARSTINGNSSTTEGGNGGGIFNRQANLAIANSTISGNFAERAQGGGIYHSERDITVTGSTIAGNMALRDGGVWAMAGSSIGGILFHSSTISSNVGLLGNGGMSLQGNIILRYATITANRSQVSATAAGLSVNGTIEVDHSIIANNTTASGEHRDLAGFGFTNNNLHFTLIGNGRFRGLILDEAPLGSPDANGNLIGRTVEFGGQGLIDPLLGPLANNGGPTHTHALLPGSPALDGGALISGAPLGFDQRGNPFSRMVDGTGDGIVRIDMGAYESQGVPHFSPGDFNRDGLVDSCDYLVWRDALGNDTAPFGGADGDGDGIVDRDDFEIWKAHFGQGLIFTSSAAGSGAFAVTVDASIESSVKSTTPSPLLAPQSAASPGGVRVGNGPPSSSLRVARATDGLLAWWSSRPPTRSADHDGQFKDAERDSSQIDSTPTTAGLDTAFAALGE